MRAANGQFLKGTNWRLEAAHWSADWLRNEYEIKQRSTGEIAAEAGTTDAAIIYWLKKHGIPRRSISEAMAIKHWGIAGENNPMYGRTGNKSPRYICVRCGAKKDGRRSLHVHHIKPWAGNAELRFDPANVITLCRGCHSWVHFKENTNKEHLQ